MSQVLLLALALVMLVLLSPLLRVEAASPRHASPYLSPENEDSEVKAESGRPRQLATPRARLIHFGWDNPKMWNLPNVMGRFRTSVFDGMSVQATEYSEIFRSTAFALDVHDADRQVLDSINTTLLQSSYIVVHSRTDNRFDWTNDAHWAATVTNMRLLVSLAKYGSFRGIVFDMEPYGKSPWDYSTQPAKGTRSWEELSGIVRERGAEMMTAVQEVYPGIEIWCLYGLSANLFDYESLAWIDGGPQTVLVQSGYGLWPAFFNGWLDTKDSTTTLVDGNEPAYYFTRKRQFEAQKSLLRYNVSIFLDPASRAEYADQIVIGHAVYVDAVMNMFGSPRFIGYYLGDKSNRSKLLYSNVLNALSTSESLVWVYSEINKWWAKPTGAVIDGSIRRGKAAAASGTSPPAPWTQLVRAERSLSNVKEIGGTFKDSSGRGYVPSDWGSALNNVGCATWGDHGEYSCAFPPNSRNVTIRPRIPGKRVVPQFRRYAKIDASSWSVNWRVVAL
jgi:hypothetical protein